MLRGLVFVALSAVSLTATAQAQDQCSKTVSTECLQKLGAGAVPADQGSPCQAQLEAYRSCLLSVVEGDAVGRPGPIEAGPLVLELARLFNDHDRLTVRILSDRLGETITWNENTIDDAYLSQKPFTGNLDLKFLGVLERDPFGISKKIFELSVFTGDFNAWRDKVVGIEINGKLVDTSIGGLANSLKRAGVELSRSECPGSEFNWQKYLISIENLPGAAIREEYSIGSGGVFFTISVTGRESGVDYCSKRSFYDE